MGLCYVSSVLQNWYFRPSPWISYVMGVAQNHPKSRRYFQWMSWKIILEKMNDELGEPMAPHGPHGPPWPPWPHGNPIENEKIWGSIDSGCHDQKWGLGPWKLRDQKALNIGDKHWQVGFQTWKWWSSPWTSGARHWTIQLQPCVALI